MLLLSVVILTLVQQCLCHCDDSYRTICDSVSDVKDYNSEKWKDLQVGSTAFLIDSPTNSIDDDFFVNLRNLHSLTIINQIRSISKNSEQTLLDYINLFGNKLELLDISLFNNFPDLRKLILVQNQIKKIHNAYKGTSLRIIDLSRNRIESVKKQAFLESSVKWANFEKNKLSSIEPNAFPPTLTVLNLDHNNLQQLAGNVFENLNQLEELTVSHNHLTELPRLDGLNKIKFLDFSYNQLTILRDVFSTFSHLKYLDLSNNKIAKFENGPRSENRYFNIKISLAFNKLTSLDYNVVIALFGHSQLSDKTDNSLSLYGNPFNCKCLGQMDKYFYYHYVKKSVCDEEYFTSGKIPVCIESSPECREDYQPIDETDFKNFVEACKSSQDLISCDISNDFYKEMNAILRHNRSVLIN